jgi:uncharacterized protein
MFKVKLGSFDDVGEFTYTLKNADVSFDGLSFEDGLTINVNITKNDLNTVIVSGHMQGNILTACSRCLIDIKQPVDSDFAAIFKNKSAMNQDDLDSDVRPYTSNTIDLFDYFRETLILEIPLKPLCREKCKGICPVCGKNNNKEKCNCSKKIKEEEIYKPFKGLDLQ